MIELRGIYNTRLIDLQCVSRLLSIRIFIAMEQVPDISAMNKINMQLPCQVYRVLPHWILAESSKWNVTRWALLLQLVLGWQLVRQTRQP